jgi:hypothetical protein
VINITIQTTTYDVLFLYLVTRYFLMLLKIPTRIHLNINAEFSTLLYLSNVQILIRLLILVTCIINQVTKISNVLLFSTQLN